MQPARFHALRNRVLAVNDGFRAEPVRLSFLKNGVADPARPAVEIEAILKVGGGKETSVAGSQIQSWRTQIKAQRAELHIDPAKYPNLKIMVKDKVRALALPGQPWFEVLAVDDRCNPRLVVQLGEA